MQRYQHRSGFELASSCSTDRHTATCPFVEYAIWKYKIECANLIVSSLIFWCCSLHVHCTCTPLRTNINEFKIYSDIVLICSLSQTNVGGINIAINCILLMSGNCRWGMDRTGSIFIHSYTYTLYYITLSIPSTEWLATYWPNSLYYLIALQYRMKIITIMNQDIIFSWDIKFIWVYSLYCKANSTLVSSSVTSAILEVIPSDIPTEFCQHDSSDNMAELMHI